MTITKAELPELDLFHQQDIDNPEFHKASRVHDWRNYVPAIAIENWDKLSLETRTYIAYLTQLVADDEEWD